MGYSLEIERPEVPFFKTEEEVLAFQQSLMPDMSVEKYYLCRKVVGILETLTRCKDQETLEESLEYIQTEHILLGREKLNTLSPERQIQYEVLDTLLCFIEDEVHVDHDAITKKYEEFYTLLTESIGDPEI